MDGIRSLLAQFDLPEASLAHWDELAKRGQLFVGWPHTDSELLANHLTYWPDGVPQLRTTAIVSSRLGRELDRQDELFRVLRMAIQQLDPRHQMLLTAERTTANRFVTRAGQLFGIGVCHVWVVSPRTPLPAWPDPTLASSTHGAGTWRCYVSPPLRPVAAQVPLRDYIEVVLADQVLALHLRQGGTVMQLLKERLTSGRHKVFLALGDQQLVPPAIADPLLAAGAVGWIPFSMPATSGDYQTDLLSGDVNRSAPIVPLPASQDWPYCTHCTRRPHAEWPDQDEEEFLDELILGSVARDRSCLAALMRILGQRRLLATGAAIRGGAKVVSFTEAHLEELRGMRTFRSHRGRWDFEPYGICIRRDSLAALGGRPVQYGDAQLWRSMSADDRPFFQKIDTRQQDIDWRVEREWRALGDLDLTRIAPDEGLVFVPSKSEAEHAARLSLWPVTILGPV